MHTVRLVTADTIWSALPKALTDGAPVAVVSPEDVAGRECISANTPVEVSDIGVIVLTSGSTGSPKGVLLSRTALRAASDLLHERLGGPGVWTCALPVHYVAGLMTLVRSWYAHTTPVFASSDLHDVDGSSARSYISVVATQLHRALSQPETVARLRDFAAVIVGGSAIPAKLQEQAHDKGITVVTSYGMSETCGGCVYDGVPLARTTVTVMSSSRIEIAGPTVFSGYRLRPDLTSGVLRHGAFLTADRGEWGQSGRLRVLGRADDVVISGGVNVDLAQIQRQLDAVDPGSMVVLGIPDAEWGTRIVVATTTTRSLEQVHQLVDVSDAAKPRAVRRFDRFPTTATGKLDTTALAREWRMADGDDRAMD